MIKYQET